MNSQMYSFKKACLVKNGMTMLEPVVAICMMAAMAYGIFLFAAIPAKTQQKNKNFQRAEFSSETFSLYAVKEFTDNLSFPGDEQSYLTSLEALLASRSLANTCSISDVSVGEAYAAAVVTCVEGSISEVKASSSSNIVVKPSSSSGSSDLPFTGSTWKRVGNANAACDNTDINSERFSPDFIMDYFDGDPTYKNGNSEGPAEEGRCYKLD